MPNGIYIPLNDRGVITIKGNEAVSFLQGLVSGDVEACGEGQAVWAALLTPQGKYLFDFFISKVDDALWLDCESARLMDLGRLLHKYKLRADVELGIGEETSVYALLNAGSFEVPKGCALYDDPRLAAMGKRVILTRGHEEIFQSAGLILGNVEQYHRMRIENGLPDGATDMTPEKALLLENGFDELSGIDWGKGCYVGQELTARTKYRGLVKKRLLPVVFKDNLPASGAQITLDGKDAGEVKSIVGNMGLALIRLERLHLSIKEGSNLLAGDSVVVPNIPKWVTGISD